MCYIQEKYKNAEYMRTRTTLTIHSSLSDGGKFLTQKKYFGIRRTLPFLEITDVLIMYSDPKRLSLDTNGTGKILWLVEENTLIRIFAK